VLSVAPNELFDNSELATRKLTLEVSEDIGRLSGRLDSEEPNNVRKRWRNSVTRL
jgi:hypothetical protein